MIQPDVRRGALHDDTRPQEGDEKGGLLAKILKRAKSDYKTQTVWPLSFHFRPSIFCHLVPTSSAGWRKIWGGK